MDSSGGGGASDALASERFARIPFSLLGLEDVRRAHERLEGNGTFGKVVLVMDNLNTHTPAALYRAFPPAEAKRILENVKTASRMALNEMRGRR